MHEKCEERKRSEPQRTQLAELGVCCSGELKKRARNYTIAPLHSGHNKIDTDNANKRYTPKLRCVVIDYHVHYIGKYLNGCRWERGKLNKIYCAHELWPLATHTQ